MSIVTPYIKNLEEIEGQLEQVATQAVADNSDFILFLIKDKQLSLGKTSANTFAGFYKKSTEQWAKNPFNKPRTDKIAGQAFDFQWSGKWLDGFFVKSEKEGYSILSRDGKTAMLEGIYGRLIELTEQNNKLVNEEVIKPALGNFILENLFKL